MGRLKIKQEDGNNKRLAYLEDIQPVADDVDDLIDEVDSVAGEGRTTETVKKNADDIASLSQNKVDKVGGKGLSTNDYTTAEKDKLGLIESEANKTIIANTLTETVVGKALDSTQGKVLDNKIGVLNNLNTTEKGSLVGAVNEVDNDLAQLSLDYVDHLTATMPHQFKDLKNDKTYNFGFQLSGEGKPQIIYEEVI